MFQDSWVDQSQPFISNEKDIYIKMTIDDELFKKYKEENKFDAAATLEEVFKKSDKQIARDSWAEEDGLPGERSHAKESCDTMMVAFSPYPTKGPYDVLPRYFARFKGINTEMDFSLKRYMESYSV